MNIPVLIENLYLACPMCMSGADGNTVLAANSAIALLMVVLCCVLASFLTFIFYLAKRAKRYAADVPGE